MGIYEATLILDNREVKKGWKRVKGQVKDLMEKNSCKVLAARRWEDRKLAYEIKKQKRGTYFLSYIEAEGDGLVSLGKDLTLTDYVLRHLILKYESVPETEVELSHKEDEELAQIDESVIEEEEGDVVVVSRPREVYEAEGKQGADAVRSEGMSSTKHSEDEAAPTAGPTRGATAGVAAGESDRSAAEPDPQDERENT